MNDILIPDILKNVFTASVTVPLLWYFIKQNTDKQEKMILEKFDRLFKTIKNTTLAEEQTLQLLKDRMLIVSIKEKIPFIRSILEFNNIENRRDQIRNKLYTWLSSYSDKYIANFKTYNTPIWDLSEWLEKNFTEKEFKKLVDDILEVMYRKETWTDKQKIIDLKCSEIQIIMEVLQTWLVNKLRKDLIDKRI